MESVITASSSVCSQPEQHDPTSFSFEPDFMDVEQGVAGARTGEYRFKQCPMTLTPAYGGEYRLILETTAGSWKLEPVPPIHAMPIMEQLA
jgi:hypothetical protein